jgi:hypothetical protein
MLDLTGEGVLALWNGVEPTRTREYNAWHSREHVAERVALPGMIGARRYVRSHGPLPEYFTLYALDDTKVLTSEPYRALLENPTAWSRAMRPSLRDFIRIACRRLLSLGGGVGGSLATLVTDASANLRSPALQAELEALLKTAGVVAAHVLERDNDIPDVPFNVGGERPHFPTDGVIVVEGYGESELMAALPAIRSSLSRLALGAAAEPLTVYRLAYAIDRGSLGRVVQIGPAS